MMPLLPSHPHYKEILDLLFSKEDGSDDLCFSQIDGSGETVWEDNWDEGDHRLFQDVNPFDPNGEYPETLTPDEMLPGHMFLPEDVAK